MLDSCIKNGNKPPVFQHKEGTFVITFFPKRISDGINSLITIIKDNPGITGGELAKKFQDLGGQWNDV